MQTEQANHMLVNLGDDQETSIQDQKMQRIDTTNNDKYDESTKFRLTYDLLKQIRGKPFYKACYKHYLSNHVRSNFAKVDSADWEIAIFLPIESFKKSSMDSVWKESRKKMA